VGVGFTGAARHGDAWPILIGDAGNVYFFACPECGPEAMETDWDCG
jgi:hypothetical protein